jgi:hypothetical protein
MRTDHASWEQPTMSIGVSRVRWPAELAKFKGDNTLQFIATLAARAVSCASCEGVLPLTMS